MIFLHHYQASLFSEKVRLLLGHLQLPWHSVEISSIMPRPLLMPLSGGYRRTPVLQIGANVYADTKIICKALARHAADESVYRGGFLAHRAADWADSQLFRVIVALNFRPEALAVMMGQFSADEAAAFAKDRAELSGGQPLAALTSEAAMGYLTHTLAELEHTLAGANDYLAGDTPGIADFSVYHNVWFLNNNPVNAPLLEPYQAVTTWFHRMQAIGHGEIHASDGKRALAAALQQEPVLPELLAPNGTNLNVGEPVTVTPVDYGCVPVAGVLVAHSQDEVVIERHTDETGRIFNHFPQAAFDVQPD